MRFFSIPVSIAAVALCPVLTPPLGAQDIPESSAEAVRAHAEGLEHYVAGRNAEAVPHFQRALELDPTFYAAAFVGGLAAGNAGDTETRDELFGIVEANRDRLSPYYRDRIDAQLAQVQGDIATARQLNRHAYERTPGTKAAYNYAYVSRASGELEDALRAMETLDPDHGPMRGYFNYFTIRADALHGLGRYEEELALMRQARQRFDDIRAAQLEARALAALGRTAELDRLLADIDRLGARGTLIPALPIRVAGEELRAHGHEGAEALLQRSVERLRSAVAENPTSRLQRERLAYALYHVGQLDEARDLYRDLRDEHADRPWYATWVALLDTRLGDHDAGRDMLASLAAGKYEQMTDADRLAWRSLIQAALGNGDMAMSLLARAGSWGTWIHRDPTYRALDMPEALARASMGGR